MRNSSSKCLFGDLSESFSPENSTSSFFSPDFRRELSMSEKEAQIRNPPKSGSIQKSTQDSSVHPRQKRKQVKNACVNCQKACKKCDDERPCSRCLKYNLEDSCRDSLRKERNRSQPKKPSKAIDENPEEHQINFEQTHNVLTAAIQLISSWNSMQESSAFNSLYCVCSFFKQQQLRNEQIHFDNDDFYTTLSDQFDIPLSYDLFNELVQVANDSFAYDRIPTPPATPIDQDFEMGKGRV